VRNSLKKEELVRRENRLVRNKRNKTFLQRGDNQSQSRRLENRDRQSCQVEMRCDRRNKVFNSRD
jgi:hypothetical protein